MKLDNEYWRQNQEKYPLNDDFDFNKAMKIIKEEREFQEEIDIESYLEKKK